MDGGPHFGRPASSKARKFLGAGTGPAVFGVLLSVRQAAAPDPINPLYIGNASAYSDTFLILTLITVQALVTALLLRNPEPHDLRRSR